jgi:hypothetical protein
MPEDARIFQGYRIGAAISYPRSRRWRHLPDLLDYVGDRKNRGNHAGWARMLEQTSGSAGVRLRICFPIAPGGDPCESRRSVAPKMIMRNMPVRTTSARADASNEAASGRMRPISSAGI